MEAEGCGLFCRKGNYMKHFIKAQIMILCVTLLSSDPFLSYAGNGSLSEQEFLDVCEEKHASSSRTMYPPLKNPDETTFNYEFHYRDVLSSPDGKSFTDNPGAMNSDRDLAAGQIIMDMADGYEVSYEYHISGTASEPEDEIIVKGKTITPYYRAVQLDKTAGLNKQYAYISNDPKEIPIIPDFPKDHDWKNYKAATLMVYTLVTVRSLKDGSSYSFESRISSITNLYKDKPDCYSLRPTDIGAYTVKKGDSLQKIAQAYYGNSAEWIYILERNKHYIQDADSIYPGTLIVIPNAALIVPPYTY